MKLAGFFNLLHQCVIYFEINELYGESVHVMNVESYSDYLIEYESIDQGYVEYNSFVGNTRSLC